MLAGAAAVLLLAVGAALTPMAGVTISPLGVAQRVSPRRMSVLRVIVTVLVLGGWSAVMQQPNVTVMLIMLGVCLAVANLVGPFFDGVQGVLTFLVVVVGALGLVMAAVSITNPLVTKVAHGRLRSSVPRP